MKLVGISWLAFGFVWAGGPLALAQEDAATPPPVSAAISPSVQDLAERVKPSIVVITFDGRDGVQQGLGTGFIVSPDGLIATNLHVIGEARPIRVQLNDGRSFDVVAIEATDRKDDLAVLRIDARDLPALPLGDSDQLRDGESVVAVGHPLGLQRSIVAGVLSGRREVEERSMLQLAIPIERGNSGGPLLDLQGRVHGLITLKSLKSENLGFAAPINQLKPLLAKPNPIPMDQWLTIGVLDPEKWAPQPGARWKQRAGRLMVEGVGTGFGGRSLCLSATTPPATPFEVAVRVKFEPVEGAAGLVFHADGKDRHYGFYISDGQLRLSRFDGPDVYAWQVLAQVKAKGYVADGWNHLKVRVEPQRIQCFLNDELAIESTDQLYRAGQVGLCKFRQTKAEFSDFEVGPSLPPSRPSQELRQRVADSVASMSPDQQPTAETVIKLSAEGIMGLRALEAHARELEAQARRTRELAASIHESQIQAELRRLINAEGTAIDLLRGALLIAAVDNPELDVESYVQEAERMVERIRATLPPDADAKARLAAMQDDLFRRQGFHGSRHEYEHRSNSYLNEVIDDREGLPITLAVLFMEVGRRLDVPIAGIPLPGHFVVRFEPADGTPQLIDVFDRGRELSVDEAKSRALEATGGEWRDEFLVAATHRDILIRMLRNLFSEARQAEDAGRMLRYTSLVLTLDPDSATDRFYRAVLALQETRLEQAREDVNWLREHEIEGLSRQAVEDLSRAIDRESAADMQ